MIYQLNNLQASEKEIVEKAPLLVAVLIAGADGKLDKEELEEMARVVHVKSFSEQNDVGALYKELDKDTNIKIGKLIYALPSNMEVREAELISQLTALNGIMKKMDSTFSAQLYNSLREIAVYVARASGGILGVGKINYQEDELVALPMLENPANNA